MHYKVYFLDGYEIKGIETVEFNHDRDIKVHNGLGQGNFPIADDKGLKSWNIKCQQDDTSLFPVLEKLLNTQKESRLIISSEIDNISEMVLLESYSKNEQETGIYDVNLKFVEYIPVSMRTTDVPYISRGGKMPTPPKTVVLGGTGKGKKTPYRIIKPSQNFMDTSQKMQETSIKMFQANGKLITNPCYLHENETVAVVIGDNYKGSFSDQLLQEQIAKQTPEGKKKLEQQKKEQARIKAAKDAMIKAKKEAIEKSREDAEKRGSRVIV